MIYINTKEANEIDIFVASKIGSLKHVKYQTDPMKNSKKYVENLVEIKSLQKGEGITCMEWGNVEQTEILLAHKNRQIQTYDTLQGFTKSYKADFGSGDIIGLGCCKPNLLAAESSGTVKIWSNKRETIVNTGGKLDRMRVCAMDPTLFATGGEENDLKIWHIGEPLPTFSAKNLPHDSLQLRRPVWVSDLTFLPGEGGRVAAVCSRYGYVRLYDTRAQRRPVCNVEFPDMAATCINPSFDDRNVLVGFGRGQLHQVDLRQSRPDKGYKGCAGAVKSIALATVARAVVSVGLDRQLRVHNYNTKELVYKQYLTSKLSCVLVQNENSTPLRNPPEYDIKQEIEETKQVIDDMDQLFDKMETVGGKPTNKKHIREEPAMKKIKPSMEGSTTYLENNQITEVVPEDAIAKLLRNTERQKRKREKKKKEKKAKSVFHNA